MPREIKNAQIGSTSLDIERVLTAWLHLDYEGSGQAFGGYCLGGQWGCEFLKRVLETVGVERWEQLKGKYIRVDAAYDKVYRIGHILNDKWFDPVEDLKKFLPKEKKNVAGN